MNLESKQPQYSEELLNSVKEKMEQLGVQFIVPLEQPEMKDIDLQSLIDRAEQIKAPYKDAYSAVITYLSLPVVEVQGVGHTHNEWVTWRRDMQQSFLEGEERGAFHYVMKKTKYSGAALTYPYANIGLVLMDLPAGLPSDVRSSLTSLTEDTKKLRVDKTPELITQTCQKLANAANLFYKLSANP